MFSASFKVALGAFSFILGPLGLHTNGGAADTLGTRHPTARDLACLPFLPKLFVDTPPSLEHPLLAAAADQAAQYLERAIAEHKIDGLSVGVVTSTGTLFERSWGVQRANESATSPPATSDSQYRIASVSKLLLAFEGWQLQQRGIISWDDPVSKYLPEFAPNYTPFIAGAPHEEPAVTLRDLATHLSGLGRDWPPGTTSRFPADVGGAGPPPENGLPFPTRESVLAAVRAQRLVAPPGAWPSYSNTGVGVLGLALVAANRAASAHPAREPASVAELMRRDVFDPLGMNGSHYALTPDNRGKIVVGAEVPELADLDFLDAMNPSGGQFASLADLMSFTRALLAPGPLTQATLDHWLRPVHAFEEDDWTELGLIFEVVKHIDSHGRRRRIYWKLGELPGYHSVVAVHPGTRYGVVVLLNAAYPDASSLAYKLFDIFQPAIDTALAELAATLYAGEWASADGKSHARVSVREGTLWLDEYVLDGRAVLSTLWGAPADTGLALRETGRRDELRIDTGLPGWNGLRTMGCFPYWGAFDEWGQRRGAGVTLVTFTGEGSERAFHVPAADITLYRK